MTKCKETLTLVALGQSKPPEMKPNCVVFLYDATQSAGFQLGLRWGEKFICWNLNMYTNFLYTKQKFKKNDKTLKERKYRYVGWQNCADNRYWSIADIW